ncbi:MAG: hypothetical protein KIH64_014455 [Mycobacterium sp.]|nr:hypothetical protein [Mycobacterium sp.]
MPDVSMGVRIGVAVFAAGVALAGPQAAGTAAAEPSETGSLSAARDSAKATRGEDGRPSRPVQGSTRPRGTARSDAQSVAPRGRSTRDRPEAILRVPGTAAVPGEPLTIRPAEIAASALVPAGAAEPVAAPVDTAAPLPAATSQPPVPAEAPGQVAPAAALTAHRPIATELRRLVDTAANRLGALPAGPLADFLQGGLLLMRRSLFPNNPVARVESFAAPTPPTVLLHNDSGQTIWVYNLTTSGDYSIPAGFPVVEVANGSSTPVTLAAGTGAPGSPENRIYIVQGTAGFPSAVSSSGGVDAFNPTADNPSLQPATANSFSNYSFVEYYLYSNNGASQYTIDTSYIDEWSLPIQMQFSLNGANWNGAVDRRKYGFTDVDTVVNQLNAAGKTGTPYADLVWSGTSPWVPQPLPTVSRIIGPDKVWAQQSTEPASNVNMNETGWVPSSYQNFVQYGSYVSKVTKKIVYPYAQNGTQYGAGGNFNFWKNSVSGPASTPYPIALRTAAILDGFPADSNGAYGFFTYPNDETAGQFTNIPTAVSLDIHVYGAADGSSDSVTPGGRWVYSAPSSPRQWFKGPWRQPLTGTSATDTFIMNYLFQTKAGTPQTKIVGAHGDIVVIDKGPLAGAKSNVVDVVDTAKFGPGANFTSQFVYETSTGYLYYDRNPGLPGYTGVLANLSTSTFDPAKTLFVL